MWSNVYWCIATLVIGSACAPFGSPKTYQIDSSFSPEEKAAILSGAEQWNELARSKTTLDEVLIYSGEFVNDDGFTTEDLTEHSGRIIRSNKKEAPWKMAEADVAPLKILAYCYGDNIAIGIPFESKCKLEMRAAHEFGHLLGMSGHIPESGHMLSAKCEDMGESFSEKDIAAFCGLFDCKGR